jgi:large subunit ribosomal protein L18
MAQLINDDLGVTIGAVSTNSKKYRDTEFNRRNKNSAKELGREIATIAKNNGIAEVIFDRGPFKYHGTLASLADEVRAAGLRF